jgi:hypothetical protein
VGRIAQVESKDAGWLTRILYTFVRRKMRALTGKATVPEPIQVTAHHTRLLVGLAQMEMAQAAAHSVPERLKTLASIKAATRIGCPY